MFTMFDVAIGRRAARRSLIALVVGATWSATAFTAAPLAAQQNAAEQASVTTYQLPAQELAALVDAPVAPAVSLSPDATQLLLLERPALPSIAELAEPELRLAGLRMNPRTNGPSRARPYTGLLIRNLDGTERRITGVPAEPRLRNPRWSPDGRSIAFTHDAEDQVQLWIADVETGQARRLIDAAVNDAYGSPYEWLPDGRSLIVLTVPAGRGEPPADSRVPAGPIVQEASGDAAPARTYQDLLEDPHDEALFEHYATSLLQRITLDGQTTPLGAPAIIGDAGPSPDGRYLLVETMHRPFSYLVPASRFPNRIEVWDTDGNVVTEIADLPLQEQVPTAFGSAPTGVRSIAWRDDADATLHWIEALDGGDARVDAAERDQLFMLEAPFTGEPTPIATLPLRYAGVQWAPEGFGLLYETWWSTRTRRVYRFDPERPGEKTVVFDYSYEDAYNNPGSPVTRATDRGTSVLLTANGGRAIFLTGTGASPEGNRPFLRRYDLQSGETDELFRSEAPYYEFPIEVIDPERPTLLTRRESNDEPANYFLRDLSNGDVSPITEFPHPYPELRNIQVQALEYQRADGVALTATLYLPPGYDAGRDGPLPTLVWAYPREYKSADAAAQRTDSPHEFKSVSYSGPVPFVTRGYAVIENAAMPIVGEGEAEPNDSFRAQLVANAQAVIDEGARQGVVDPNRVAIGGHSYGAFMTGNLLAHSDLFRAGIARSGAYNRTLTPSGFQSEERLYWEAPDVYFTMSPFMHAEKVDEPILLIHGEADNNSGTFPIQSERFFAALKGLGQTARLIMLPHESHGYAARESVLHMLWEEDRWLEQHVKNAPPRADTTTDTQDR